jgi:acyl carrier protein
MSKQNSISERVQALLADAIQVPVEMVTSDLAFGDLPQWDSLGHMEVMLKLEDEFGVPVDTDAIANLISIPKICQFLEENGYEK